MSAVESILLYGVNVWANRLQIDGCHAEMGSLRISGAYLTVSENSVLVITEVIPIDLQVAEQKKIY